MNKLVSLKSPLSVNLEITPVCDLSCEFCFNAELECKKLKHSPLKRIKSILDELANAEVFEIRLFGGEFLTYPYWYQALKYANSLGFFISFVSNGTQINAAVAKTLLSHGVTNGAVSIHGTEKIHDRITGVNKSFKAAIRGIEHCISNGIEISILYTLTKANVPYVFKTCKWLKERKIDIKDINVGRLAPYGRAINKWEEKRLSLDDYHRVFPELEKIRKELNILASFGDAFPLCLLPKKYHEYVIGCWQGTGFGHIDHKGNVRSCSITRGSYGNLLETPLREIWTKRLSHFRSLKWLPVQCQKCTNFCGGGCSASRFGKSIYAPDEFLHAGTEDIR